MNWSEKTVIFDLDGTLIDSAPDLHAALVFAFNQKGMPAIDLETVRSAIGHGALAMIKRSAEVTNQSLSDADLEDLRGIFLEHYIKNISRLSRPYDGILDTLRTLKDNGAKIAVCTNKTQALAEQVLDELKMSKYFSAVLGADKASRKKPDRCHIDETIALVNGNVKHAVMIGDSSTDGNAAKSAAIPFIFMTYGYPDDSVYTLSPVSKLDSAKPLMLAIEAALS